MPQCLADNSALVPKCPGSEVSWVVHFQMKRAYSTWDLDIVLYSLVNSYGDRCMPYTGGSIGKCGRKPAQMACSAHYNIIAILTY